MLKIFQYTIKAPINFEGIGLHTGKNSNVRILPGKADQGIIFKRTDLKEKNLIPANFNNVCSAKLCTTLQNEFGVKISTVEHLLAALYISEIDNAAELWGDTQQWISSLGGFRVIKTHNICGRIVGIPHPDPKLTHAAICVVRDPRDVAVSYASHYGRSIEQAVKLLQMEDNFTFQPDNPFRKSLVGSWQTNFTSWLDASFPVLAVRYEDLLAAPEQEITRILEFLNLKPAIPSREIASLTSFGNLSRLERLEGFDEVSEKAERFFRKGSAGQWRDHGVQIDSLTKAFRPLMMQLGYLKNEDS